MTTQKSLTRKIAMVTGASRGIGRCAAQQLADAGATVILTATNPESLTTVAAESGSACSAFAADLVDELAIEALIAHVKATHGRLDILVNNAGVTFSGDIESTTVADWDGCMAVNARGPFLLCRAALPLLRLGHDPCIVNISSVVGIKGYAQQTAYTASKHALRGFSLALAEELRPAGIRVHVICPGGVDTDMVQNVRPDIPKDELISPDEVAEAVLFLVARSGQGLVDEIRLRRRTSAPWF
ncbi:SDR family oxidoreductase [Planctomycetota bacterium]